jgi:hypothetical protein
MNNISSLPRVALMALALGTAGVTATFAQTTTSSSTTPSTTAPATTAPACTAGGWHHHHSSVLTTGEKAQLKKAHDQALASNGTLQTEQASLKQQFETLKSASPAATHEQWQALHQQKEDFRQNLKAAELLVDPTLTPIFTKLEAAHEAHHHST